MDFRHANKYINMIMSLKRRFRVVLVSFSVSLQMCERLKQNYILFQFCFSFVCGLLYKNNDDDV